MFRLRSLLLLVLAALLAGCEKPGDPTVTAQLFFQQVAAGQTQAAYQSAAFGFQAQRSAAVFEAAAKEMGLVNAVKLEWDAPEIDGRTAKIRVRVKPQASASVNVSARRREPGRNMDEIRRSTRACGEWAAPPGRGWARAG